MVEKVDKYRCYYEAEFPIDEFGRLGGLYSLADLPITQYKSLTRRGNIVARNKDTTKYLVRDVEKMFEVWVPIEDVHMGDQKNGGNGSEHVKRKSKFE
jgi:hypothetical protein|tara:strand:- start:77 stop:370 length:294 start_codon:yes stop_codon:yes gene_type:complete